MALQVGIVIPVYRDLKTVKRCVSSVLKTLQGHDVELLLVNDASPEPAITQYCRDLSEKSHVRLIEHSENLGFVASVNEGIVALSCRDVIILNSDTEVPLGWIERLVAAAETCPDAASVTPFSNNATICSYPNFCENNSIPENLDYETIDKLFAKANKGLVIDIPTGVGFCMFMRRAAIEEIGIFDEQAFGRGYGEENDWCLRAASKGWKHILCADLFVYHAGGASFGAEAQSLQANALRVLSERYPNYEREIAAYIEADSIESARYQVDTVRPDTRTVISEYRERERAARVAQYELDSQRQEQVAVLEGLLDTTRESAREEGERYQALLSSQRAEAAAAEDQYLTQLHANRESAREEGERYQALLSSQRAEAAEAESQYQTQLEQMATQLERMAAENKAFESQLSQLNRFWPVRVRNWLLRRLGRR